jgi:hypothetical protein
MHICTVCSRPQERHSPFCYIGDDGESDHMNAHVHAPALCCAGCDCRSAERSHTVVNMGSRGTMGLCGLLPVRSR